ncbi:MAG: hypothetical protein JWO53_1006 [Chlamydiia bacterium]|nr:hypothetical protein [Chlamydiia bacterium]
MMSMKQAKSNRLLLLLGVVGLIGVFLLTWYGVGSTKNTPLGANHPTEKSFVVVIPSYNNKNWYKQNLDSVLSQNYTNFRVIFIDDASPDGTGALVKEYLKEKKPKPQVKLIQNEKRAGALANLYNAISTCDPQEIIITVDGDDWLAEKEVLAYLNKIYADPNVWVTYGQFIFYPNNTHGWAAKISDDIIKKNGFRDEQWYTTHLRTFYAELFHQIKKEDLFYNGEFYPMAGDLAVMFPIIEMAGTHSRFIPDVLYVYNVATQQNDHVTNPSYQSQLGLGIRDKNRYLPLDKLW